MRGTLIEVHIADLHFGVVDPIKQYLILTEQFLNPIENLQFDILSINGDIFHHKYMANSPVIMYALQFIDKCIDLCRKKNATFIIISGTESHDAGQIKLFYHYLEDPTVDIRIVEQIKFEYIKGAKILCIPEEYGKSSDYYRKYLSESDAYDSVFLHGTIKGSVYGANSANLNSDRYPVFDINSFEVCQGPIIAGHVHTPGCFETYMYYCGSPIRFRFGEEEEKGFIILLHNLDNQSHYVYFNSIKSFRYDTITIDALQMSDPNNIISYLNNLHNNGIDNIRIQFTKLSPENISIIKNYYKNNSYVSIMNDSISDNRQISINTTDSIIQKYSGMDFLLDSTLNEYDKFVKFINYNKGSEYITVDQLKKVLEMA